MVLENLDGLALTDAIERLAFIAAFGVLAAVLIGLRRVDDRLQRLIWSHGRRAEGTLAPTVDPESRSVIDDVSASLGEGRLAVSTHDGAVSDRLSAVEQRMTSIVSALNEEVSALRPRLDELTSEVSAVSVRLEELSDGVKGLGRTSEVDYEQLEAYVDLRSLVRSRAPMPALRGWAASPDVVRLLAEIMWRRRPKLTVECGSGSSSVWLGYVARQIRSAKVVALEHDERFAGVSRDLVRAHGLEDVVEIRLAPLATWERADQAYSWYGTEALEDLTGIGLLFVDGPPGSTGPQARFPAMPLLLPRCGDDAVIVLDDSDRDEEIAVSDRWLAEHPELDRVVLRFDKGAHVFTRRVP